MAPPEEGRHCVSEAEAGGEVEEDNEAVRAIPSMAIPSMPRVRERKAGCWALSSSPHGVWPFFTRVPTTWTFTLWLGWRGGELNTQGLHWFYLSLPNTTCLFFSSSWVYLDAFSAGEGRSLCFEVTYPQLLGGEVREVIAWSPGQDGLVG